MALSTNETYTRYCTVMILIEHGTETISYTGYERTRMFLTAYRIENISPESASQPRFWPCDKLLNPKSPLHMQTSHIDLSLINIRQSRQHS